MSETIHVSVAWPYANGDMHVGHLAGAYLPADIVARYHRLKGNNVLMVSGSDMHGTPITISAEKEGITPEEVANLVVYVCSPAAAATNGAALRVDGGVVRSIV